jgi:hypothetical protein
MPLMDVIMVEDGKYALKVMTPILKEPSNNLSDVSLSCYMAWHGGANACYRTGSHNKPDGSSASTTSHEFL